MKRIVVGYDAHAGLRESHPSHEGGPVCLSAESTMAVSTPERRCCGHETHRAAHALACEFAHSILVEIAFNLDF